MKLPFRLPFSQQLKDLNLSEKFDFSSKELKIIGIALGSLLFCAVVITALAAGLASRDEVSRGVLSNADFSGADQDEAATLSQKPFLSDFIILDDNMGESFTKAIKYREPVESWSDGLVQRFWINPEEIASDLLEIEADKVIKDIFADVR